MPSATATAPLLRLTGVTRRYARSGPAVLDVSFSVAKGEFLFLAGHSGAGKSTALRLIAMAELPSDGTVEVAGFSSATIAPRDIPALRRRLGIVYQDFRLLPDRTAEDNVAFAMEVTGARRDAIASKVTRLLAQVGLGGRGTAYPHELSGGEQQRVAIARALANDPLLLLADEPTGNLDDRARRGVFRLLRDINAAGTAVVLATHDIGLIERSGLRYIELERGRVVYDGYDAGRLVADLTDIRLPVPPERLLDDARVVGPVVPAAPTPSPATPPPPRPAPAEAIPASPDEAPDTGPAPLAPTPPGAASAPDESTLPPLPFPELPELPDPFEGGSADWPAPRRTQWTVRLTQGRKPPP